ncbi:MAG TPA: hypothetical protein VI729_04380 [Anaerolineales bacterium]|nr:hypothetical protein [Anaerolineales bacterium]
MNDGVAMLIAAPVVFGSLVALFSLLRVLFPVQVGSAKLAAIEMPGRSFALGTVNLLLLSVIVAALGALGGGGGGIFQLLALILVGLLVIALGFGLAGMSVLIGERLLPDSSLARQTAWGSATLVLASLTPFLGWFGLFPYLAILGLGGFLIGLFRRSPR